MPGIFIFVLGVGNLSVGHYKHQEYTEVFQRLNSTEFKQGEAKLPLARIEADRDVKRRSLDRLSKVQQRREFYSILHAIGKCLTVLGVVFVSTAFLLRISKPAST